MQLKWKPLGLVFNPAEHHLPLGCEEFAQAPQAIVLEDRIRVLYSTRQRDTPSTFKSHVGSVDFSLDWSRILEVNQAEILPLGALGTFDEHGVFPINVLQHQGLIYGFTTGWSRRISVSNEAAIGLVTSEDEGRTFKRLGPGPILSASLREPFQVADGCVLVRSSTFHMFYIAGRKWIKSSVSGKPERVYKILHAKSADLRHWERDGVAIISDVIDENECQALPTVFEHQGIFHMIFCHRSFEGFRNDGGRAYDLGYASSSDLINWTRSDEAGGLDFARSDWDSTMRCYPNVVQVGSDLFMLYNGNSFGRNGFGIAQLIHGP
jgi:hypothetical protein